MTVKHLKVTGFRANGTNEDLGTYIIDLDEVSELLETLNRQHPYVVRMVVDIAL